MYSDFGVKPQYTHWMAAKRLKYVRIYLSEFISHVYIQF
jgi:hypothetical protein